MSIGTHNKRYKTLKEHRAAVAARKTLQGGKNKGPVANADAYGSAIKKPKAKAKKVATAPKPAAAKPKAAAKPAAKPTAPKRPNQTKNGASLGSTLSPAEKAKRAKAASPAAVKAAEPKKKAKKAPVRGTARGGSRASNNNRGRAKTTSGPQAGDTRRTRKGSKYVTQMYNGKTWVNGKVGGKG